MISLSHYPLSLFMTNFRSCENERQLCLPFVAALSPSRGPDSSIGPMLVISLLAKAPSISRV